MLKKLNYTGNYSISKAGTLGIKNSAKAGFSLINLTLVKYIIFTFLIIICLRAFLSFPPKILLYLLTGNYATLDELPPTPCEAVEGSLPRCLEGAYLRNGSNPQFLPPGRPYHLFDGDGMVQMIKRSQTVRPPSAAATSRLTNIRWSTIWATQSSPAYSPPSTASLLLWRVSPCPPLRCSPETSPGDA